jgi:hypothetical protein
MIEPQSTNQRTTLLLLSYFSSLLSPSYLLPSCSSEYRTERVREIRWKREIHGWGRETLGIERERDVEIERVEGDGNRFSGGSTTVELEDTISDRSSGSGGVVVGEPRVQFSSGAVRPMTRWTREEDLVLRVHFLVACDAIFGRSWVTFPVDL